MAPVTFHKSGDVRVNGVVVGTYDMVRDCGAACRVNGWRAFRLRAFDGKETVRARRNELEHFARAARLRQLGAE